MSTSRVIAALQGPTGPAGPTGPTGPTGPAGPGVAWFNVVTYGATGNGSTDDTAAFNSAIAAFNLAAKGVLYFPAGSYKTTSGLTTITAEGIIRGDGAVDLERGDGPVSEITLNSATDSVFTLAVDYAKFEDLTIRNTASTTPSAGAGITVTAVTNTQKIDYDSIDVRGFYIGIDIAAGADWTMFNTTIRGPVKYAVKIRNTINADNGDWSIVSSSFYAETYAADAAIRIESSGGGKITTSKINEGSYPSAGNLFVRGIDVDIASATNILLVSASSIENVSGVAINVSNTNTFPNIVIVGNEFGMYSNSTHSAINITGQDRIVIIGNTFNQTGGGTPFAITLNTCDSVQISGNVKNGFAGGMSSLTSVTTLTNLNGTPTGTGSNPVLDTSPTIVTPTIASFANANHTHQNSAGGGTLSEAALALTNVTTNNASITAHGFLKLLDNNAAHYMDGTGNWSTPAGSGSVSSVAMTGDGTIFNATVSGSPITTSGTLAPALLTQTANFLLAGPTTGAAAAPTFRAMVAADIPSAIVSLSKIANASANSKLLGSGSAGSGASYSELTLGTGLSMSGTTLSSTGSPAPIASGSANPGSPATNDLFFRTDLGLLIYYDGTRWLTLQTYRLTTTWLNTAGGMGFSATTTNQLYSTVPYQSGGTDIYMTNFRATFFVVTGGTALGPSHKWVGDFHKEDTNSAATTVATTTIASGSSAVWRVSDTTVNLAMGGSTYFVFRSTWTKTGTPGNLIVLEELTYRIVVT